MANACSIFHPDIAPAYLFVALVCSIHFTYVIGFAAAAVPEGSNPAPAPAAVNGNYSEALSMSLLFLEAQRSGKLPPNQRVTWRGDSALGDGSDVHMDLTGGYYDAGDNVKFVLPMAFTVTVLAWETLEYSAEFAAAGQLSYVREAIQWGTDFLLKASAVPNCLWVQVGNAQADHSCWERPETMRTPRTSVQINTSHPGTQVAAETAAALAAASMVFESVDANYSQGLLQRAFAVFQFADKYRASYTAECPYFCGDSVYEDELLWAAAWLLEASGRNSYLRYVRKALLESSVNTARFDWDNKFAGVSVLLARRFFEGDITFSAAKAGSDYFVCANLPGSSLTQVSRTPGGLLYVSDIANTQYAGGAALLAVVYADYLAQANQSSINCNGVKFKPTEILSFARSQVDYILGKNALNMSYMVGYTSTGVNGSKWPQQVHHRGASISTAYVVPDTMTEETECYDGFLLWYARNASNPNEAVGAIVGGPNRQDMFLDLRSNSAQLEPTTYINALFTGVFARLVAAIT